MWQRKMLQFTARTLLLLLPWFGGLASGEIVDSFSECRNFFYKETPPEGFTGTKICQRYRNKYRFATLYDRQHRTALYSAYLLSPSDVERPDDPWMYEPQLVPNTRDKEMQPLPRQVPDNVIRSQAVLADYVDGYTKGHLAPSQHLNTMEDREASFTLTNIVPQREESNSGTWNHLENRILRRFKNYCTGQMYVVTGTIPYMSVSMLNNRVSVPEYIWSAYCCPSFKSKLPKHEKPHYPTYAAVGRNDPDSGEDIVTKVKSPYAVKMMPLADLEKILNERLNMTVSLFHDHCLVSKS